MTIPNDATLPDCEEFRRKHESVAGHELGEALNETPNSLLFRTKQDVIKILRPEFVQRVGVKDIKMRITRLTSLDIVHANIVRVKEAGFCDEVQCYYIVMAYVSHPTLEAAVRKEIIKPDQIKVILRQMTAALEYLDGCKMYHRDIKPSNITFDAEKETVTLLDLDVLLPPKEIPDATTGSSQFLATYEYAPPELIDEQFGEGLAGHDADRAMTFYQIGAVLFFLLEHEAPFSKQKTWPERLRAMQDPPEFTSHPGPNMRELIRDALRPNAFKRLALVSWESIRRVASGELPSEPDKELATPTVVLIHTGGTIVAREATDIAPTYSCTPFESRFHPRLQKIKEQLLERFRNYFDCAKTDLFDLQWEILAPDQQIFSENATPAHWEAVRAKIQDVLFKYDYGHNAGAERTWKRLFDEDCVEHEKARMPPIGSVDDFRNRHERTYLAGVIVLYGTDTMAFLAPALHFSLSDLPCPVIITGANQPFFEDALEEEAPLWGSSDGWRNLLRCMHFIRCIGHRLRQVFVCFGPKVHHAVNQRKFSNILMPMAGVSPRSDEEPFTFLSQGNHRAYMFRLIEGVWCNNFYPSLNDRAYGDLHDGHQRRLWRAAAPASAVRAIDARIAFMQTSPVMAENLKDALAKDTRILLLTVYMSGTKPTKPSHPLVRLYDFCQKRAIPIVEVSPDGHRPGTHRYAEEGSPKTIRLYRILPETALPLLCTASASIDDEAWGNGAGPERLEARTELIMSALATILDDKGNIINELLGNVTDEFRQQMLVKRLVEIDTSVDARDIQHRLPAIDVVLDGVSEHPFQANDHPISTMARQALLWHNEQERFAFEPGLAPEHFVGQMEMGFRYGMWVFLAFWQDESLGKSLREGTYVNAEDKEQACRRKAAQLIADRMMMFLVRNGLLNVHRLEFQVNEGNADEAPWFAVSVSASKVGTPNLRDDQLFTVQGINKADDEFLKWVSDMAQKGAHLDVQGVAKKNLISLHNKNTWCQKTTPLDWYLAGYTKAYCCEIARHIRFDEWAEACWRDWNPKHIRAMRRAVRLTFDQADQDLTRIRLEYRGSEYYARTMESWGHDVA